MSQNFWIRLGLFFSVVGLTVASYLSYLYYFSLPIPCNSGGCEVVRNSPYSKMFGIYLPTYGVLFYCLMLINSVVLLVNKKRLFSLGYLFFGLSGFIFSAYLTFLEIFVIKAICIWCVVSAIIATILFGIACLANRNKKL